MFNSAAPTVDTFRIVRPVYTTTRERSGDAWFTGTTCEYVADADGDYVEKTLNSFSHPGVVGAPRIIRHVRDCNATAVEKVRAAQRAQPF